MKLSYKTKDSLIKIGFILMLTGLVLGGGYSYVECQTTFVEGVLSEAPVNIEESIKSKAK